MFSNGGEPVVRVAWGWVKRLDILHKEELDK